LKKFKWWWTWSSEKFEEYLEVMAAKGWELEKAGFGLTSLSFKKNGSKKIRYCVDYFNEYPEEYDTIVRNDGWELKGKSSGWRLWAKVYEGQRPHLLSDKISLIDRNKRLLRFLFIILSAQIPVAVINYSSISESTNGITGPFGLTVAILYSLVLTMLVYSIIRIATQNEHLKKQ
jgi:hypothetical protein